MGTLIVQSLIDKVAGAILNDRSKVRFTQADALAFFNEGQRFICANQPSALTAIIPFTLAAGAQQAVPAGVHAFLGASYNLAQDGTTPGRRIFTVKSETIDVPDPDWRTRTKKAEIRHIIADDELPGVFDVYPPAIAGTKIAIKVAQIPADIAATAPITLEDTYEEPLMNYMLSRLYQKNAEFGNNIERATSYRQAVLQYLGTKAQVDPAVQAEQETRESSS